MDPKTTGVEGSDDIFGSDVTAIETVTVCYFDRKNRDQIPKCTVKTRVLNEKPAKSDPEPPNEKDPPSSEEGKKLEKPSDQSNDQMCHLPSKELTRDAAEALVIDCMEKAKANEDTESTKTECQSRLNRWRNVKRKRDTV